MTRDILILRDPRESWRKCSLAPLRGLEGVRFVGYREGLQLVGGGRVLLAPDAPPIEAGGGPRPLLLLDSSWRRLKRLRAAITGDFEPRSLPLYRTAYPRRSETFEDPAAGLASAEALFLASCAFGEPDFELLRGYRFAAQLFELNPDLPRPVGTREEAPCDATIQ